jgi:hypothetical protein
MNWSLTAFVTSTVNGVLLTSGGNDGKVRTCEIGCSSE